MLKEKRVVILMGDNEGRNRSFYRKLYKNKNLKIVICENKKSALNLFKSTEVSAILLDFLDYEEGQELFDSFTREWNGVVVMHRPQCHTLISGHHNTSNSCDVDRMIASLYEGLRNPPVVKADPEPEAPKKVSRNQAPGRWDILNR